MKLGVKSLIGILSAFIVTVYIIVLAMYGSYPLLLLVGLLGIVSIVSRYIKKLPDLSLLFKVGLAPAYIIVFVLLIFYSSGEVRVAVNLIMIILTLLSLFT